MAPTRHVGTRYQMRHVNNEF